MEPLRVLQVMASLDRGGAESMIMSLYRAIDKGRVQFDFVVNKNENEYAFENEIKELGGRIYYVPRFNFTNWYLYRQEWIKLFKSHPELQIIHSHHTSPAFIYLRIANAMNRATIAHSHTSGGNNSIKSLIKIFSRFPVRYIANYRFACSNAAAKWMFGKRSLSAQIVNNAIDTNKFKFNEQLRNKYRTDLNCKDKFVIGHVGRFDKDKNQSYLIDIFKAVYSKNNNSMLLLVGEGALRSEMEKKVKMLDLADAVIFTGVRSEIPELLQAMDVFVFPSLFEGLPVTVIEAQASGLKCFLSDSITEEVKITDLIEFISLEETSAYWADQVLKYANGYKRKNMSSEIFKAGYDIRASARWLENFYLNTIQ